MKRAANLCAVLVSVFYYMLYRILTAVPANLPHLQADEHEAGSAPITCANPAQEGAFCAYPIFPAASRSKYSQPNRSVG